MSSESPAASHAAAAPIPIVLGVCGHRDIPQAAAADLEREVRAILSELLREYPHTPLVLLSPLAAGADRLVARVALEEECQVGLIVPLPWPEEAGADLWHRTGERGEFDALFGQALRSVAMPLPEEIGPRDIRGSAAAREEQYATVGRYIARHSQLLIALWDGVESGDGGTWKVIRAHRAGEDAPFAPSLDVLDQIENGPVIHVRTPRESTPGSVVPSREVLYPAEHESPQAAEEYFARQWQRLDDFNADVGRFAAADRGRFLKHRGDVDPGPLDGSAEGFDELLSYFAAADTAAVRFQNALRRAAVSLFAVVAAAVVLFEVYSHLLTDRAGLLGGYIALLFLGAIVVGLTRRRRWQEKHIDYRALAESLRVQFFWMLAGRSESAADHYLRNFRSELDWIRQATRTCRLICGGHLELLGPQAADLTRLNLVQRHWVQDQSLYFNGRAGGERPQGEIGEACKRRRTHHRFERWAFAAYASAVVLAVTLLMYHLTTDHLNHYLVVLVFLCAAAAALVHEFADMAGYAADAARYRWVGSMFRRADHLLTEQLRRKRVEEAAALIYDLGIEALNENADWVRQHRLRPLKSPSV